MREVFYRAVAATTLFGMLRTSFVALLLFTAATYADAAEITIETPMPPPGWALLERELLAANTRACEEFFARYFDERGYLLCVERWGADDGPDDAIENVNDWPRLHALGASERIRELYEKRGRDISANTRMPARARSSSPEMG